MCVSITEESQPVKHPAELDQVLALLRDQFHAPELALAKAPRQLTGGFWAELWLLSLTGNPNCDLPSTVVLRLAPDANLAAWEVTVQSGVARQGYPTPRIHASYMTPASGQRAWYVMDFVAGSPLIGGLSGARALRALPHLAKSLPDTLARAAADLHRLDPVPIDAALRDIAGHTVGVDGLLERYRERADELSNVPLQRTLARLAATRPDLDLQVVCHGDLHPFNVLTNGDEWVVLDWTPSQVAHPAYDLAFTHLLLANPPLALPRPIRPLVNAVARRLAKRFLATYRALGPHPIDHDTFEWFRILQACRIMIDLASWQADGTLQDRAGHPWLVIEPAIAPMFDTVEIKPPGRVTRPVR